MPRRFSIAMLSLFVAFGNAPAGAANITASTYLGGTTADTVSSIAIDSAGFIYIAGFTDSANLNTTPGVVARFAPGGVDAFVAKLSPDGKSIVFLTYLGGAGDDRAFGIVVDASSNVYVAGATASLNFPVVQPVQATLSGTRDAFLVKLNSAGTAILKSTYLGGTGSDIANGISLNSAGDIYIAGETTSANLSIVNPIQASNRGGTDGFLIKLTAAFTVARSTYFGGSGDDRIRSIAVNSSGQVYIAGDTTSANLPIANAVQSASGGYQDAFVAKFSDANGALVYSTYLGGTGGLGGPSAQVETAAAVAVDSGGSAYITGITSSLNFPTTSNAFRATHAGGGLDAFLTILNSSGALVSSTYLGGVGVDVGNAIAVDTNNVYIAGDTTSVDLPVADAVQSFKKGLHSAFVQTFALSGEPLRQSTYLGGSISDAANAIAVCGAEICLAGQAASFDFPVKDAPQPFMTGLYDGFVSKLTKPLAAPVLSNRFFPLTPCRVVDTRENRPAPFGAPLLPAGIPRNIPVPVSGCPVPSNALAYAVNVTALPMGFLGHMSLWPTGQPQPIVSTLNAWDGFAVANSAIVPAGTNGSISVVASNSTHFIVDINGYFAPALPGQGYDFVPTTPCRVADSREAGGFLGAGVLRNYPIPMSGCPIPASAVAYAINATAIPRGFLGHLIVWPGGQGAPLASTLNAWDGNIIANGAIIPAGTGGAISAAASNATDLIIDVNGYFPSIPGNGYQFRPLPPCRIVDTREASRSAPFGAPFLAAGVVRAFPVPAAACGIPPAAAYSVNVTALPKGFLGFLTIWPSGEPMPLASTLNASDGSAVANGAIVRAGVNSGISVFASNPTDLIIDVNGYFAP